MYKYEWDPETGGYILTTNVAGISKELRPVFHEELNLLGLKDLGWVYPESDKPLMWAETRRYIYRGELVAEAIGGGLYTRPEIKIYKTLTNIQPVNIKEMVEKNRPLLTGLVQNTVETIYKTYNRYKNKVDVIYIAFSGGKDSLVLLDLVQKALPHNEFKVIFADTSMDISDTYKTIDRVKEYYPDLDIQTARSHLDAKESWNIFGPPGRVQRWCCSVHKTAPSILKLRNIVGKDCLKTLVYDGVRGAESSARATYSIVSTGLKHATQTNCSPILDWVTPELFLYIFANNLILNRIYRYGATRIGCVVCPMSTQWWDFIVNNVYPQETKPFIDIIEQNCKDRFIDAKELEKYIDTGGWKGRMGGRDLVNGGSRIIEQIDNQYLMLLLQITTSDWKEWIKAIGKLHYDDSGEYIIDYKNNKLRFTVEENINKTVRVRIKNDFNTKDAIRFRYLFKNVFYKTAYCNCCKVCMVECPVGALKISDNYVKIDNTCINCELCLDMPKGCLLAKSLSVTMGGTNMNHDLKGINRYNHFGFRKVWLQYFFEYKDEFWGCGKLGKYQFDGFKVWLKEAELTDNNLFNQKSQILSLYGIDDIRVWAVIFNNLAYNSTIVGWYIKNIQFGVKYDTKTIITMLGDNLSVSSRENAVTSLKETFRYSPIGNEIGAGICELKGNQVVSITRMSWRNPDPLVVLYSLFKFAEKCDGYYSFTLSYLCDEGIERNGISPSTIFGLEKDVLKAKIQNLATDYKEFISATFSKDLDNIDLNKEKTSLDVLKMF